MYTNTEDFTLRICQEFAMKVWNTTSPDGLQKPSTRFDGCGLLAEDNSFEDLSENGLGYIIPSKVFNSFEEFINNLTIPYYDNFSVVIDKSNDINTCFNYSQIYKVNHFFFAFLILVCLLF